MKPSMLVFIFAMLGLVFFVVIVTTSGQWRKIFKGRNYIQILIVVPLTIAAFLLLHLKFFPLGETEQKFDYGIVDDFLTGIINGMFLALVALLGFDVVSRRREEDRNRERLRDRVVFVEGLLRDGMPEEALKNSQELFADIYKEIDVDSTPEVVGDALVGNLEVYAESMESCSTAKTELNDKKRVEQIYDEIFQRITVARQFVGGLSGGDESADAFFRRTLTIGKNEKEIARRFIRHICFLNDWLDCLISLASYTDRIYYQAKAESVIRWAKNVLETGENLGHRVNDCLEYVMQKIKYQRLKAAWHHVRVRQTMVKTLSDYPCREVEEMLVEALRMVARMGGALSRDDRFRYLDPREETAKRPWGDTARFESITKMLKELVRAFCSLGNEDSRGFTWDWIVRYRGHANTIDGILRKVEESWIMSERINEGHLYKPFKDVCIELVEIYKAIALNRTRYIQVANENKLNLTQKAWDETNGTIRRALRRTRELLNVESDWKHWVGYLDNLGIYLTERGDYELKKSDIEKAKELYDCAVEVHRHQVRDQFEISDNKNENSSARKLLFLRNQINLGRAYKGRYTTYKCSSDFEYARRELEVASETALRTGNFVYAGRALRYLGQLYEIGNDQSEAIKKYLRSLEMFSEEGYPAYHEKIVDELHTLVWNNGKGLLNHFIRDELMLSMNLCNEFDKHERCPLFQGKTDLLKEEAFKRMLLILHC